jgi:hypothetical protein
MSIKLKETINEYSQRGVLAFSVGLGNRDRVVTRRSEFDDQDVIEVNVDAVAHSLNMR